MRLEIDWCVKLSKITSLQIYAQMKEAKRFYRPGSKRTKEFMLARTMMVLVLVFLILNTPRLLLGLIEVNETSGFLLLFSYLFLLFPGHSTDPY